MTIFVHAINNMILAEISIKMNQSNHRIIHVGIYELRVVLNSFIFFFFSFTEKQLNICFYIKKKSAHIHLNVSYEENTFKQN